MNRALLPTRRGAVASLAAIAFLVTCSTAYGYEPVTVELGEGDSSDGLCADVAVTINTEGKLEGLELAICAEAGLSITEAVDTDLMPDDAWSANNSVDGGMTLGYLVDPFEEDGVQFDGDTVLTVLTVCCDTLPANDSATYALEFCDDTLGSPIIQNVAVLDNTRIYFGNEELTAVAGSFTCIALPAGDMDMDMGADADAGSDDVTSDLGSDAVDDSDNDSAGDAGTDADSDPGTDGVDEDPAIDTGDTSNPTPDTSAPDTSAPDTTGMTDGTTSQADGSTGGGPADIESDGCDCSTSGARSGLWLSLLIMCVFLRRRRAPSGVALMLVVLLVAGAPAPEAQAYELRIDRAGVLLGGTTTIAVDLVVEADDDPAVAVDVVLELGNTSVEFVSLELSPSLDAMNDGSGPFQVDIQDDPCAEVDDSQTAAHVLFGEANSVTLGEGTHHIFDVTVLGVVEDETSLNLLESPDDGCPSPPLASRVHSAGGVEIPTIVDAEVTVVEFILSLEHDVVMDPSSARSTYIYLEVAEGFMVEGLTLVIETSDTNVVLPGFISDTGDMHALRDGQGPESETRHNDPCADGSQRIYIADFDITEPFDQLLGPGEHEIAYVSLASASMGTAQVFFPIVDSCGDPVRTTIVADGTDYTPYTHAANVEVAEYYRRGDVNDDLLVDIADLVRLVEVIYNGQTIECDREADVNSDGAINADDLAYLWAYRHESGPAPAEPFETPVTNFVCSLETE